jgi:hypothetical protein
MFLIPATLELLLCKNLAILGTVFAIDAHEQRWGLNLHSSRADGGAAFTHLENRAREDQFITIADARKGGTDEEKRD